MVTACGWGEQLPTIPWWVQNTVIESQNRRDWKRPLEIPQSNPLFECFVTLSVKNFFLVLCFSRASSQGFAEESWACELHQTQGH